MSVTLAAAVGPALSISIYSSSLGFNGLLALALILLILTFVLIFFVHVKELSEEEVQEALLHSPKGLDKYIEKSALPISFVAFWQDLLTPLF